MNLLQYARAMQRKIRWEILIAGLLIALAIFWAGQNGRFHVIEVREQPLILDTRTGVLYDHTLTRIK